jgi:cytochrome P450
MIGRFVEELLRLQPPTHGLFRTAVRDAELGGVTIPAGAQVCILFAAANDDGNAFPCPEKLDVDRANIGQNLTFGAGIHRCIGIALARMEIRVAAQEIIRRLDNIRLAVPETELRYLPTLGTHTLEKLPLTFTPRMPRA